MAVRPIIIFWTRTFGGARGYVQAAWVRWSWEYPPSFSGLFEALAGEGAGRNFLKGVWGGWRRVQVFKVFFPDWVQQRFAEHISSVVDVLVITQSQFQQFLEHEREGASDAVHRQSVGHSDTHSANCAENRGDSTGDVRWLDVLVIMQLLFRSSSRT